MRIPIPKALAATLGRWVHTDEESLASQVTSYAISIAAHAVTILGLVFLFGMRTPVEPTPIDLTSDLPAAGGTPDLTRLDSAAGPEGGSVAGGAEDASGATNPDTAQFTSDIPVTGAISDAGTGGFGEASPTMANSGDSGLAAVANALSHEIGGSSRGGRGSGGGMGAGTGAGHRPGKGGGVGSVLGGRGGPMRGRMVGVGGGTKGTERAVALGLNWMARHQAPDGHWSIDKLSTYCRGGLCTGDGSVASDVAGTAMGLLPFLAAGQTHRTKGPYREVVEKGLRWLMVNQDPNTGNLAAKNNGGQVMYSHGMAAIALCEAYAISKDPQLRPHAQLAINFIAGAQDSKGGGWRYMPHETGDMSVSGWQLMAIKSAQMGGLNVRRDVLSGAHKFLRSVRVGDSGQFAYLAPTKTGETPSPGSPALTAAGLLCEQYLGMPRSDKIMVAGKDYILKNLPNVKQDRDSYYWYYATQVIHNIQGADWDTWNRAMRRVWLDTQVKEGHSAGSWDPNKPDPDKWGPQGGRLFVTSVGLLTLEVYYRYLPLYKVIEGNSDTEPDKKE